MKRESNLWSSETTRSPKIWPGKAGGRPCLAATGTAHCLNRRHHHFDFEILLASIGQQRLIHRSWCGPMMTLLMTGNLIRVLESAVVLRANSEHCNAAAPRWLSKTTIDCNDYGFVMAGIGSCMSERNWKDAGQGVARVQVRQGLPCVFGLGHAIPSWTWSNQSNTRRASCGMRRTSDSFKAVQLVRSISTQDG